MSDLQREIRKQQEERKLNSSDSRNDRPSLANRGDFDEEIYGGPDKSNYVNSLPSDDEDEDDNTYSHPSTRARINPPRELLNESIGNDSSSSSQYGEMYGSGIVNTRIADRENEVSTDNIY
jgi:hypothetical protein